MSEPSTNSLKSLFSFPNPVNEVAARLVAGMVFALQASTGERLWDADLGVNITAAPIVADKTLLIGTEDGVVLGLDVDTGTVIWDFKTGGKITASPVVAGDTMYVASQNGKLYAIGGPE